MPTERDLLDALWARMAARGAGGARRYVLAEHVRYHPQWAQRIADAIALDTWGSGQWAVEGYEVKTSRSDWRRELADPTKAQQWRQHCSRWYVVAPAGVVPREELPKGWGLVEAHEVHRDALGLEPVWRLIARVQSAVDRDPAPLPRATVAGLMRAVQQTAEHHARASLTR